MLLSVGELVVDEPGAVGGLDEGLVVAECQLLSAGMYEVPCPPPPGGKFDKPVWEEYQVVKREREYHGCLEEYNGEKKGEGEAISSHHDIKAVGKNIKKISGENIKL